MPDDDEDLPEEMVQLPITGELDLHTFSPREVKDLVADYLDEAARLGLDQVRIVHGKGTGVLRRIVHGVLERHPCVVSYQLGAEDAGGWGATVVRLRPPRT